MIENMDLMFSLDTNPYYFRHFYHIHFTLFFNGRPILSKGFPLDMGHEKTSFSTYNTLFEGSGIRHSNSRLQVTHRMFIAGYLILMFGLKTGRSASEGQISFPEQGNIRLELQLDNPLPEAFM